MIDHRIYLGGLELEGFKLSYNKVEMTVGPGAVGEGESRAYLSGNDISVRPDDEYPVYVRAFLMQDEDGTYRLHLDRFRMGADPIPAVEGRMAAKLARFEIPPGSKNDPDRWTGEMVECPELDEAIESPQGE